jgi:hypothetical protein
VSPVKFGTSVRYDLRDLDDYLDRLSENKPDVGFAELAGNESAHSGH